MSILAIIANGLRIAANWFDRYSSKPNIAARELSEDNKKLDETHNHIKDRDLDGIRKDLNP